MTKRLWFAQVYTKIGRDESGELDWMHCECAERVFARRADAAKWARGLLPKDPWTPLLRPVVPCTLGQYLDADDDTESVDGQYYVAVGPWEDA